ncbi:low temperature requirement protein A [Leifsonia sp. A12D58]|uniref:low temperature requirement protein A n=1 Tax=Leifsonia sp. A12D58 TaxID=3397674 RepID=UPI0039E0DE00
MSTGQRNPASPPSCRSLITLLAWAFFSYGTPSAEKGWRRLHAAGDIGGLRDTVMYLPFVLVTAVVLIAAGLGTAVAEPADPLPTGATVAITGGLSLFYFTNALEMLRYREPVRNVLPWAVVGVVLPFVLLAFSAALDAVYLVLGAAAFVGIMVAIAELNRRRQRAASVTVSGEVQA